MRKYILAAIALTVTFTSFSGFLEEQLAYSRVRKAYAEKKEIISNNLSELGFTNSTHHAMIKAYKSEQIVRVFVKSKTGKKWKVYKEYPFCYTSGNLGPKRQQGDYQIPEGFYKVNHFNPYSNFHLSMGVSYPNRSDRIKSTASDKGGAIYMHGGCATIGCIPIEDEPIKELYILCVLARNNGQSSVPIHILPFDYTVEKFVKATKTYPEHKEFWTNLYDVEKDFIKDSIQKKVYINKTSGDYYLPS